MSKNIGKKIASIDVDEARCLLTFADGARTCVYDNAQICCEKRYMTCEDDYKALVGQTLLDIKAQPADCDICFVDIRTDKDSIQLVNHNEHNGYYGGFDLRIQDTDLTTLH